MTGGWPAEGRLAGRSAASGRLVDGDEGDDSVWLTGEVVADVGWRGEGLKEEKNNPGALGGCLAGKKMNSVGATVFLGFLGFRFFVFSDVFKIAPSPFASVGNQYL
ncbi:hypothetical protein NC651_031316 [Populus alba x Populus x berolinensis]|nr:hypothetical protein NC651_031316 [Populus alba x Populus x berolinensis]